MKLLQLDNKTVLVAAHGNSLRALAKHIEGISDEDIMDLEIPTGQPLVYELNDDLTVAKNTTYKNTIKRDCDTICHSPYKRCSPANFSVTSNNIHQT